MPTEKGPFVLWKRRFLHLPMLSAEPIHSAIYAHRGPSTPLAAGNQHRLSSLISTKHSVEKYSYINLMT